MQTSCHLVDIIVIVVFIFVLLVVCLIGQCVSAAACS